MNNGNLEEELFYTAHKFIKAFNKNFMPTTMAPPHMFALIMIDKCKLSDDGVNPSILSEKLKLTRPAMTHTLNSLEQEGYIVRKLDTNDRRKFKVKITKKGKNMLKASKEEGAKKISKVLSEYGEDKTKELIKDLNDFTNLTKTTKK